MTSATIASSERRLIFGLGATGQSVARWWRQQGLALRLSIPVSSVLMMRQQWPIFTETTPLSVTWMQRLSTTALR